MCTTDVWTFASRVPSTRGRWFGKCGGSYFRVSKCIYGREVKDDRVSVFVKLKGVLLLNQDDYGLVLHFSNPPPLRFSVVINLINWIHITYSSISFLRVAR